MNSLQSWNDYGRPFVYAPSKDEKTDEAGRSIQETLERQERTRRQNNYNILAEFREELKKESYASAYISTIYEEMCEREKYMTIVSYHLRTTTIYLQEK